MKRSNQKINTIIKKYGRNRLQYIFMKYSVDLTKCRCKKEKNQERVNKIAIAHHLMDEFKIFDKKKSALVYFEVDNWIAYQISDLIKSCNQYFLNKNKNEIMQINRRLEELTMLFKDRRKLSHFTMRNMTDSQNYNLELILQKLSIELEECEIDKSKYSDIDNKISYILKLLSFYKVIKSIEKKRYDNILRAKNKLEDTIYSNDWDAFLTITFDNRKANRFDMKLLLKKVQSWFTKVKRNTCPDLKFIILPDISYGKGGSRVTDENGNYAVHFHCLLANIHNLEIAENLGISFDKKGRRVFSIPELDKNLGFSYLTFINEEIDGLCKYFRKRICLENEYRKEIGKRYYCSQNLKKCRIERGYLSNKEQNSLKKSIYQNKENKIHTTITNLNEKQYKQKIEKIRVKKISCQIANKTMDNGYIKIKQTILNMDYLDNIRRRILYDGLNKCAQQVIDQISALPKSDKYKNHYT